MVEVLLDVRDLLGGPDHSRCPPQLCFDLVMTILASTSTSMINSQAFKEHYFDDVVHDFCSVCLSGSPWTGQYAMKDWMTARFIIIILTVNLRYINIFFD